MTYNVLSGTLSLYTTTLPNNIWTYSELLISVVQGGQEML